MDTMGRILVTDCLTIAGAAAGFPGFAATSVRIFAKSTDGIAGLCSWELTSLTDTGCISSLSGAD